MITSTERNFEYVILKDCDSPGCLQYGSLPGLLSIISALEKLSNKEHQLFINVDFEWPIVFRINKILPFNF